jgi:4-hydroxy-4-methyl-2-oxoglutarate aldolase
MSDGTVGSPIDLERVTTAHLVDVSPWGVVMDAGIQAMWPGAALAGPAFTVRTAPGDNASLQAAIAKAGPGDVIVADGHALVDRALWGAIMSRAAQLRGIAGLVLDGAVRDRDEIRQLGFPVFARAWTPLTPYNKVPGATQVPITCGGLAVGPGDAIYADGDGVVVIPRADHDATLARAHDRIGREARIMDRLEAGDQLADLLGLLRSEVGR